MGNPFVHVELATTDAAKAKSFYGALFDWQMKDVSAGPNFAYTVIRVGNGTGGGLYQAKDTPPMWLAYVQVDDIKAATRKARELGATIVRDCVPVGREGVLSIFKDPQGAMLGLWQVTDK